MSLAEYVCDYHSDTFEMEIPIPRPNKNLSGVPRITETLGPFRYVWKLVYMFMLGYEIDFGHMEMISLISSTK